MRCDQSGQSAFLCPRRGGGYTRSRSGRAALLCAARIPLRGRTVAVRRAEESRGRCWGLIAGGRQCNKGHPECLESFHW